jgi:hypothetical protein
MGALDSYTKETRQAKDDALKTKLIQQQLVAGEDVADDRKRKRSALADIFNSDQTKYGSRAEIYQKHGLIDEAKHSLDLDELLMKHKAMGADPEATAAAEKGIGQIKAIGEAIKPYVGNPKLLKMLIAGEKAKGNVIFKDMDPELIAADPSGQGVLYPAMQPDPANPGSKIPVPGTYFNLQPDGKVKFVTPKTTTGDANKTDYQSAKGALIDQGNPNPTDTQIRALMQEDKTKVAIASRSPKDTDGRSERLLQSIDNSARLKAGKEIALEYGSTNSPIIVVGDQVQFNPSGGNPEAMAKYNKKFGEYRSAAIKRAGLTKYVGDEPASPAQEKAAPKSHPLTGKESGRYKVDGKEVKWDGKKEI